MYLVAKFVDEPILDGGLIAAWDQNMDVVFLDDNSPVILYCYQTDNLNFVLLYKIKINQSLIRILSIISGLLYAKTDNWVDLQQYIHNKEINFNYSLSQLQSNPNLLEASYLDLANKVNKRCEEVLKSLRESDIEVSYLKPVQSFLAKKCVHSSNKIIWHQVKDLICASESLLCTIRA